jgi:hypothetical protein
MLASIHPLGERARNSRWSTTATAYFAGSLAGGALLGAAAGALGELLGIRATRPAVVASCGLAAIVDLARRGRPVPSVHRQVDENWLARYRNWVYGAGFGFQLGLGVVTIVTTAAVYLTFVLALLSGSVAAGQLIGATFGLARAIPVIGLRGVRRPEQLRAAHRRYAGWAAPVRHLSVGALLLSAAAVAVR